MKIININTDNIIIAKNMIIRKAIECNLQYVEMENEVLIDNNLFRITNNIDNTRNNEIIEFDFIDKNFVQCKPEQITYIKNKQYNKKELKKQSKMFNQKIKQYKRRGY